MTTWRKSSYSGSQAECVEVGVAPWRKSGYSGPDTNCVETGAVPGVVLIRDTKDNGTGPVLRVTPGDWRRFTASVNRVRSRDAPLGATNRHSAGRPGIAGGAGVRFRALAHISFAP